MGPLSRKDRDLLESLQLRDGQEMAEGQMAGRDSWRFVLSGGGSPG